MVQAITGWRTARSFIGAAATEETAELDFNIPVNGGIEIASVLGLANVTTVASVASIAPVHSEQSLHIEDGTIEALNSTADEVDQFESDSEVFWSQSVNLMAFDGTTEGAAWVETNPNGLVTFARPILSLINLTHRTDNDAAAMDIGYIVLIEYRYVSLSDRELAFEFARRRR